MLTKTLLAGAIYANYKLFTDNKLEQALNILGDQKNQKLSNGQRTTQKILAAMAMPATGAVSMVSDSLRVLSEKNFFA